MKILRRNLIALALAGAAAVIALPAFAQNVVTYTPAVLQNTVDEGQPYMLDFSATWCATCKVQERVLDELQSENAAFNDIPILRVDWDTYRSGPLVAAMSIPRRSTLVMMVGENELGRIVAGTAKSQIQALMELGL